MMPEKKESKVDERYSIVEVPTQMASMVQDSQTNETLDQSQLLLRIANDVALIRKTVA